MSVGVNDYELLVEGNMFALAVPISWLKRNGSPSIGIPIKDIINEWTRCS